MLERMTAFALPIARRISVWRCNFFVVSFRASLWSSRLSFFGGELIGCVQAAKHNYGWMGDVTDNTKQALKLTWPKEPAPGHRSCKREHASPRPLQR